MAFDRLPKKYHMLLRLYYHYYEELEEYVAEQAETDPILAAAIARFKTKTTFEWHAEEEYVQEVNDLDGPVLGLDVIDSR